VSAGAGNLIYVLPYLELRETLDLADGYSVAPRAVLAMYTRPAGRTAGKSGAVVLCGGHLGSELSESDLQRLTRTVGFALLEANPRADVSGYSSNAGQQAWTSENAFTRGHRVSGDGMFVWAHNGIRSSHTVSDQLG
jgi:hypothetical protein